MSNRQKAFDLVNDHNVDREALCNYLLNDWLSGDQAKEAVTNFLEDEMGVDLDDETDEESDASIAELEKDLWNQPTGAPPVIKIQDLTTTGQKQSNFTINTRDQDKKDLASMRIGEGI